MHFLSKQTEHAISLRWMRFKICLPSSCRQPRLLTFASQFLDYRALTALSLRWSNWSKSDREGERESHSVSEWQAGAVLGRAGEKERERRGERKKGLKENWWHVWGNRGNLWEWQKYTGTKTGDWRESTVMLLLRHWTLNYLLRWLRTTPSVDFIWNPDRWINGLAG